MKFPRVQTLLAFLLAAVFSLVTLPAFAQSTESNGKLKIHVSPKQAYVFVDGKAIRDGSQTIDLQPGSHEVSVRNYGYLPNTQKVQIDSKKTTDLTVALQASGDKVSGPFGDIELKGHPRAAVLLNGTTPDYFVGHVDEFDNNWIWHQRLLVKPGNYQVTVTREGNQIWSGPVEVKAGQRVIVHLDQNGKMETKNWPQGNTLGPQSRFHAGVASAIVPIAPVSAQLTAQSTSLECGQPTRLNWKSADAVAVSITNLGKVSDNGERSVTPTKTTAYELVAKGPGGEATQTATIDVDVQPTATVTFNQPEIHFHKIGDKVVQDDPATLNWSVSGANHVTITPLGSESTSGSRTVEAQPKQTSPGPVNEVVDYTLSASNACGGTTTKTAALHIVGSIDPAPPVTLASLFYPSNYPQSRHPKVGLVATEKEALADAAQRFKEHEQYTNDHATLVVVGHADVRGPKSYNLMLSKRRAELVKNDLIAQGIAADKIEIRADGKQQELSKKEVSKLQAEDPQKPEKWMVRRAQATWLAYNRRVDIILEPAGKQSTDAYPNDAADARILWERAQPSLKKVEVAANSTTASQSLHADAKQN
ncbi:MAG TPA: OmpA family protein [Terriglobales bacterium]|nr:OmpA family protein [Terriglobales bacterium]